MCLDAVDSFSWLCAHTGSTWCGPQWWTKQRWWPGCQSVVAAERRWPWWSGAGPSGSSWSSAHRWPHPSLTHRCSPGAAGLQSGRKTTGLWDTMYNRYTIWCIALLQPGYVFCISIPNPKQFHACLVKPLNSHFHKAPSVPHVTGRQQRRPNPNPIKIYKGWKKTFWIGLS